MTSGWQGAPHFRRYGRELVSKPAISFFRKIGGAIVERLTRINERMPTMLEGMVVFVAVKAKPPVFSEGIRAR